MIDPEDTNAWSLIYFFRVESSNYMPQIFWNAGCQMVALNYQVWPRMEKEKENLKET